MEKFKDKILEIKDRVTKYTKKMKKLDLENPLKNIMISFN